MNPHVLVILKKMCEVVNADVETIDFKENAWYLQHYWTTEQQNEFINWLAKHLHHDKQAYYALTSRIKSKKRCEELAREFVFNYGWTTNRDNQICIQERAAG